MTFDGFRMIVQGFKLSPNPFLVLCSMARHNLRSSSTAKRTSFNQICSPYFLSSKRSRKSNPKTCSPYFSSNKRPRSCKAGSDSVSPSNNDDWVATTKLPQHLVGNRYFEHNKNTVTLLRRLTPEDFSLSQTICSYGYFCLAPNRWVPSGDSSRNDEGYLVRPLTFHANTSNTTQTATVAIGQDPQTNTVLVGIKLGSKRPNKDELTMILPQLTAQIDRMLRLDMNLQAFHEVYPEAKNRRFGRLYRSPTLFEDVCKTITNCNMQWGGTVDMNAKLCKYVGKHGAFPTPLEMYNAGADFLKEHCRVGYRSNYLWNLAREIVEENLDLETDLGTTPNGSFTFERKEVQARLLKLKGIGPFAANNILQLMGYFDSHPYDTETVRLWKEDFGAPKSWTKKEIFPKAKTHYAPYAPFEFTAYWYDLWKNYERRAGATAPQWSIEQYEAERPQNVTSDHNCVFAHPTGKNSHAAKTKGKPTKKKTKKKK